MAALARRFLIDEALERDASRILAEFGMSVDDAVNSLLKQVVLDHSLPFPTRIPNAEAIKAMEECERGEGKV